MPDGAAAVRAHGRAGNTRPPREALVPGRYGAHGHSSAPAAAADGPEARTWGDRWFPQLELESASGRREQGSGRSSFSPAGGTSCRADRRRTVRLVKTRG
ncbi:hypothetical protein GCM10010421_64280 [Streptomyces glaucus]|uniref:Secreted protein n=1 Tax=Streptomyces glaucus TaxID=284029 RepID=A0ABP5XP00_9ACTN